MLFVCHLVVRGAWEQTLINRATRSAVTETSMALFYLSGVVFGVLACVVLLNELWLVLSGRAGDSLFGVVESEDAP
jgi:TRAP-type C4-dicarboxylate transport system permease small subunit